jgi:NAD(P)H dehydrogenase (quinone)
MKIFILLAHPDCDSFNSRIAELYRRTALARGHEVRIQRLGEMKFDPVLWKAYKQVQDLEPDLKLSQENILWCHKWVIIYPIWWGSIPALFKGFLDRTLLPGFAFKYRDKSMLWDKLLAGREAELITTCDAPWWWILFQYRNSDLNTVKKATLQFCGIWPVKTIRISGMRFMKEKTRNRWLEKIGKGISQAR